MAMDKEVLEHVAVDDGRATTFRGTKDVRLVNAVIVEASSKMRRPTIDFIVRLHEGLRLFSFYDEKL